MVCPCCGGEMATDGLSCSCGARVVGPPITEPDYIIPKIGRPVLALTLAILSIPAFIWKWLVVFSLAAVWLARSALRQIKIKPQYFGGRRTAQIALALALLVVISVTVYVVAGIPKYLHWRAERERAATRAQMYRVAIALHDYKRKHGAYPANLDELQLEGSLSLPVNDEWENRLKYRATVEVATDSKSEINPSLVLTSFNQYQLVSSGPDGKLGTPDDMVMRDDIIISPSQSNITADEDSAEE
ncbi:MAG: hypothetical protein AB1489_02350 [Acidobacteriota bacterium]